MAERQELTTHLRIYMRLLRNRWFNLKHPKWDKAQHLPVAPATPEESPNASYADWISRRGRDERS